MIQECDVLNQVLSLVMQASAALKNVTTADNGMKTKLLNFEIKDKFAPAQKNEVQVPLKKTSKEPGRKKKSKQLRYVQYTKYKCSITINMTSYILNIIFLCIVPQMWMTRRIRGQELKMGSA